MFRDTMGCECTLSAQSTVFYTKASVLGQTHTHGEKTQQIQPLKLNDKIAVKARALSETNCGAQK